MSTKIFTVIAIPTLFPSFLYVTASGSADISVNIILSCKRQEKQKQKWEFKQDSSFLLSQVKNHGWPRAQTVAPLSTETWDPSIRESISAHGPNSIQQRKNGGREHLSLYRHFPDTPLTSL